MVPNLAIITENVAVKAVDNSPYEPGVQLTFMPIPDEGGADDVSKHLNSYKMALTPDELLYFSEYLLARYNEVAGTNYPNRSGNVY